METLHYTRQLSDHAPAMTFCGIRLTTDHAGTRRAKQGPWVSCPICELARTCMELGDDLPPLAAGMWIQPPLDGLDKNN